MYPKKRPKTDREKFYEAFGKKVGCKPEQYLRRKLAGGMPEDELRRLYDLLAVEIAMKARCTAIRYDSLQLAGAVQTAAERHVRRAATHEVPTCARCGARMVLRTGQSARARGRSSGAAPTIQSAGTRRTWTTKHEKFQIHHQL